MAYEDIKNEICDVCHKMWQLGWVAANDGNVTVKLEDGTFLATPTGISKSFITPDKLVRIDAEGNILEANEGYRPSSEIKMHLRCYKDRDDVGAVLHAHPPTATGFAVAHVPLDRYDMIETVVALGPHSKQKFLALYLYNSSFGNSFPHPLQVKFPLDAFEVEIFLGVLGGTIVPSS